MDQSTRVLIVEDEFITLDTLRDHLEQSGYEISGDAMRADEALDILERFETDLVMLDINLKGEKDGIWLAEQIRQHYHIPFIFLTAYSDGDTVQRAAKTNPYGYLVKPFTRADIFSAIEVALTNYAKEIAPLDIPEQSWTEGAPLLIHQSIFVRDAVSYRKINLRDIRYIQAFKNYLELHVHTKRILVRSTLQKLTTVLPQSHFVQIHRSFMVNIRFVEEIGAAYVSVGDDKLPLSKNYKDDFVTKFNFFV